MWKEGNKIDRLTSLQCDYSANCLFSDKLRNSTEQSPNRMRTSSEGPAWCRTHSPSTLRRKSHPPEIARWLPLANVSGFFSDSDFLENAPNAATSRISSNQLDVDLIILYYPHDYGAVYSSFNWICDLIFNEPPERDHLACEVEAHARANPNASTRPPLFASLGYPRQLLPSLDYMQCSVHVITYMHGITEYM